MFFLKKRSNFEKKPHELSYRSNTLHNFLRNINTILTENKRNKRETRNHTGTIFTKHYLM